MNTNIFYDYKNDFFLLLGEGICWKNQQDKVFLLRQLNDNQVYAIPDYIFHMNFINITKEHTPLHLKQIGWTEFAIKKFEKNYAQLLENNKNLSS